MTGFGDLVSKSKDGSVASEFRVQRDSGKADKKTLYRHSRINPFKNFLEAIGLYKESRAAKRKAGAEEIAKLMDDHYQKPGFGVEVMRSIQSGRESSSRNIEQHVIEGDMPLLKLEGDRLRTVHNLKAVREFFKSDPTRADGAMDFEKLLNSQWCLKGTTGLPHDTHGKIWQQWQPRLNQDIETLRNGGNLKDCSKLMQGMAGHIAVHADKFLEPDDIAKLAEDFVNQHNQRVAMVYQANARVLQNFLGMGVTGDVDDTPAIYDRKPPKQEEFTPSGGFWDKVVAAAKSFLETLKNKDEGRETDRYIGNVIGLVDEWFEHVADKNKISQDDREWLKNELGRLRDPALEPAKKWDDGSHLGDDEIAFFGEQMVKDFDFDRRYGGIYPGSGPRKDQYRLKAITEARQITNADIVGWHHRHFARLIAMRRKKQATQASGATEQRFQERLDAFPLIKRFVNSEADRAKYSGGGFGQSESLTGFFSAWMRESGTSAELEEKLGLDDADALLRTLTTLDEHSDLATESQSLLNRHGSAEQMARRVDSSVFEQMRHRADALLAKADDLDRLAEAVRNLRPADSEEIEDIAVIQQHHFLTYAANRIREKARKIADPATHQALQAYKTKYMLMQLPHIQQLHNAVQLRLSNVHEVLDDVEETDDDDELSSVQLVRDAFDIVADQVGDDAFLDDDEESSSNTPRSRTSGLAGGTISDDEDIPNLDDLVGSMTASELTDAYSDTDDDDELGSMDDRFGSRFDEEVEELLRDLDDDDQEPRIVTQEPILPSEPRMPSEVVSHEARYVRWPRGCEQRAEVWGNALSVLDRYAEFANVRGPRLSELEARIAMGRKLEASEASELHTLRQEVDRLDRDIKKLADANDALAKAAGNSVTRAGAKILGTVRNSVSLMRRRLHRSAADTKPDAAPKGLFESLTKSVESWFQTHVEVRSYIHGAGKVPVTRDDLTNAYTPVARLFSLYDDVQLPTFSPGAAHAAAEQLPQFDADLAQHMREDPLAQRPDRDMDRRTRQIAMAGLEVHRLRSSLRTLRSRIENDRHLGLPPDDQISTWAHTKRPGAPRDIRQRRQLYFDAIDHLEARLEQFDNAFRAAINDITAYEHVDSRRQQ